MAIKKPIKPIKPNEGVITGIIATHQSALTVMKSRSEIYFAANSLSFSLCLSSKLQLISRTRHFLPVRRNERGKKTCSCGQRRLFRSSSRCCECLRVKAEMRRVAAVFLRRIEASVSGLAAGRSVSVGLCALCDNPPSTPLFPLYPALFLCSLVPPTPLSSALSP